MQLKTKVTVDVFFDPMEFAFHTGLTYRGLTISERPDGYNIICRATRRGGEAVYAMVTDHTPQEGLENLLEWILGGGAKDAWRVDRYAK